MIGILVAPLARQRCALLLLTLLISFKGFSHYLPPSQKNIDPRLQVLKQEVLRDILSAAVTETEVDRWQKTLRADGSWSDINYADKTRGGWQVNDHLSRLLSMALLCKNNSTRWSGDAMLQQKLLLGLNYWLKNDFICPNWWYPQIGVPKTLAPLMLLLEDKLSPAEKEAGIKILERSKIGMTGQNKVWLSGNVIYRSLLTGDVAAVEAAVNAIQEEIVVSEGEGVQADYSFHQHGTQQQFGNYGAAYAGDMLKWARIFEPTAFRFAPEKIAILRNYLLQGMRWIVWKNKMDISACGRQLFPHAQADKARGIGRVMANIPSIDKDFTSQYQSALNDFSGNKHFWKSDMSVHRRSSFYVSVKMSSVRVGGAESCNEENIQGYHLGDGASYFYQSNNEYTDIFPYWDWKMIPGITAFHDEAPLPVLPCSGYNIASHFVGGVSDSSNGIATLAYHRDSLDAQKSWFFFNDAVLCLGAGIHTKVEKEVRSTVNQSFYRGEVKVKEAGHITSMPAGKHQLNNVQWVLHDNWGYYFPVAASVGLRNEQQSGNWHHVLTRMPDSAMQAPIFTLWFDHLKKPAAASYAYIVLAGADAASIEKRGAAISILSNTANLQAAENKSLQMASMVFVQPGSVVTSLFGKISLQQPGIVMITKKYARYQLALADPTHQLKELNITLKGQRRSALLKGSYNKEKDETSFVIALPSGADAGKTVLYTLE